MEALRAVGKKEAGGPTHYEPQAAVSTRRGDAQGEVSSNASFGADAQPVSGPSLGDARWPSRPSSPRPHVKQRPAASTTSV